MIETLSVKDFILIDELKIDFSKGFNVITGETGAGKSIIINAIDIAFGAKASKEIIKTGAQRSLIELTLTLKSDFDTQILEDNAIDFADNELIISREITPTASRSRVNGAVVTGDFIKKLREKLLDIHSQHQTYAYIQPKHHINLLDGFADDNHKILLEKYKSTYFEYVKTSKSLDCAKNVAESNEQQIDFLKFQIQEIEDAQITNLNEELELENELSVLANAEALKEHTYSAYWMLNSGETDALSVLNAVKNSVGRAAATDNTLNPEYEELTSCIEVVKDISGRLRNYSERLELNEERIDEIQQRLDVLDKIKRKYGKTHADVLHKYRELTEELGSIEFSGEEIVRLTQKLEELKPEVTKLADALSQRRLSYAQKLSGLLEEELEKLELPKTRFSVDVQECELNDSGKDRVEFLISTNISEPLKPLAKVASGGEISRIMLAVKTIFAVSDDINTVIFDEIDAGVSGKASQAVSEELVKLARTHQVVCITHQPIIAAKSQKHFYVTKDQHESTKINIYDLSGEEKVKAIATLAGGQITEDAMNFARQLIEDKEKV